MAKNEPNKPDDKKTVPAGDTKTNDKTVPGNEQGKADGKAAKGKSVPAVPPAQDKKPPEAPAPAKGVEDKTKAPTPDKAEDTIKKANKALLESTGETPEQAALRIANINLNAKKNKKAVKATPPPVDKKPEPDIPPTDEKLKEAQEAALKSLDEKAAFYDKNKTAPKKTREARPPTGVPKETPPPQEPEKAPEPKEAPRPGDKEEIVYLKLNELFPFKDHPFGVRDDAEMRAMVEIVKDKGITQPAIVRPREDGGYELVSGHRRQKVPKTPL